MRIFNSKLSLATIGANGQSSASAPVFTGLRALNSIICDSTIDLIGAKSRSFDLIVEDSGESLLDYIDRSIAESMKYVKSDEEFQAWLDTMSPEEIAAAMNAMFSE
jgi:hypothetical protein